MNEIDETLTQTHNNERCINFNESIRVRRHVSVLAPFDIPDCEPKNHARIRAKNKINARHTLFIYLFFYYRMEFSVQMARIFSGDRRQILQIQADAMQMTRAISESRCCFYRLIYF